MPIHIAQHTLANGRLQVRAELLDIDGLRRGESSDRNTNAQHQQGGDRCRDQFTEPKRSLLRRCRGIEGLYRSLPPGGHARLHFVAQGRQRFALLLKCLCVSAALRTFSQMPADSLTLLRVQDPEHIVGDFLLHLSAWAVHRISPCVVRISCNSWVAVRSLR